MKLFSRSLVGSLFSPKKDKDEGAKKDLDPAAPSVPAIGKDGGDGKNTAAPSVPGVGKDIPTPAMPGIGSDIPKPAITDLDKDLPTPSAARPDPASDGKASPPTVTTTVTVSVTQTRTITSALSTFTVVQHDLGTVATTVPTTLTLVSPDPATERTSVPTTLATTDFVTVSTKPTPPSHPSAAHLPTASGAQATAKKHVEPAIIASVVFGLLTLGLLGVICFLVLKVRRMAKTRPTVGVKTYAEEFEWPQPRAMETDGVGRKDEWGPKQKEAWGVA